MVKSKRVRGRPPSGPDHPLAKRRLERGMSRPDLAKKLDLPEHSIFAIEHRRSQFPPRKLIRLAKIFGETVEKLAKVLYPE